MPSLRVLDSSRVLRRLGYEFYSFSSPGCRPELSDVRFLDLASKLAECERGRAIAGARLYRHQAEALEALESRENLVLVSGSGSGKTEAWFLYCYLNKVRALAIYPTLALANDQVERLRSYSMALGLRVEALDSVRRRELARRHGRGLGSYLATMDIIATNPAFLMAELKRWASGGSKLLYSFCQKAGLIVVDEFDFYGPREASLMLSMLRLMKLWGLKFQVALLTATLGNPREAARALSDINGLETRVVEGKPFSVENRTYVVLGKDLKALWLEARKHAGRAPTDIREALEDYGRFKENAYRVYLALKAAGCELPAPAVDYSEVVASYARDEGVTLVFTRSIRGAEEVCRRVRSRWPELAGLVKAHHHLVSKAERAEIEKAAREGRVKVVVSPRTLAQGIDIGLVIRVVHLGLPESVREFRQREGRKGRRPELPYTETVILPYTPWDRELLSRGAGALREWTGLSLEAAVLNPGNKYSTLFEGLYKLMSRHLRGMLTREELELLEELKLAEGGKLTEAGRRAWRNMSFYEYGPPYGLKRLMLDSGAYLEDIGYCDMVERFQIGCLDYSEDAIVVGYRRKGRVVTGVEEAKLSYRRLREVDAFAQALEEYEKAKAEWGESPDFLGDYYGGRLFSEVICVVEPPARGFGRYLKVPNRVYWRLLAPEYRAIEAEGRTYFIRESKSIPVTALTAGAYRDFTYGAVYELEPDEDLEWLRVGLAFLMIALRLKLNLPLELFKYEVHNVGDRKVMGVHEPSSAGLLESLDWLEASRLAEELEPTPIVEVLLKQVDDQAHYQLVSSGARWDLAKRYARRAVDYMLAAQRIRVKLAGRELAIPKPSRALRLAAVDLLSFEFGAARIGFLAVYDGEEALVDFIVKELLEVAGWGEAGQKLERLVNQGFTIVAYSTSQLLEGLKGLELRSAAYVIEGLVRDEKVADLSSLAKSVLGVPAAPLEELLSALGWSREVPLKEVWSELTRASQILEERGWEKWPHYTRRLREKASAYTAESSKLIYTLYTAIRELMKLKAP